MPLEVFPSKCFTQSVLLKVFYSKWFRSIDAQTRSMSGLQDALSSRHFGGFDRSPELSRDRRYLSIVWSEPTY
jgi:hypothetical protein